MRTRLIWSVRLLVMAVAAVVPAFGTPVVNLGTASSFGLLGGTISNTGTSVVTGNVGVDGSGTITGFNPTGTTVGGSIIAPGSTSSNNAYTDFVNSRSHYSEIFEARRVNAQARVIISFSGRTNTLGCG